MNSENSSANGGGGGRAGFPNERNVGDAVVVVYGDRFLLFRNRYIYNNKQLLVDVYGESNTAAASVYEPGRQELALGRPGQAQEEAPQPIRSAIQSVRERPTLQFVRS